MNRDEEAIVRIRLLERYRELIGNSCSEISNFTLINTALANEIFRLETDASSTKNGMQDNKPHAELNSQLSESEDKRKGLSTGKENIHSSNLDVPADNIHTQISDELNKDYVKDGLSEQETKHG